MATVNLGRIKPVFKGAYAGGTAYVVDDIVTSGNETFICIQASTGNATSNASYWTKLASKGADGSNGSNGTDLTSTLTTQGDIVYRDGSGLARLGYGTSGKVLTTKGSGQNPVWETASGGKVLQVVTAVYTGGSSHGGTSFNDTGLTVSITPSATSSKVLIITQQIGNFYNSSQDRKGQVQLLRGSTQINLVQSQSKINFEGKTPLNFSMSYLDSPSTNSATTYKHNEK